MKRLYLCTFLLLLSSCSYENHTNNEIIISAAASLQAPLEEIVTSYEKINPNVPIIVNYGGSGSLQTQIAQGAPVDLFISASSLHMKSLVDEDIIKEDNTYPLMGNSIVVIKSKAQSWKSLQEVVDEKSKIAIGTPATVPAGKYAKQSLQNTGLWTSVVDYLVYAKDVTHVLTLVEEQSVSAGFVYGSDVKRSEGIHTLKEYSPTSHEPIIYTMGVIEEEARPFKDYLLEASSQKVFERYGFQALQ
ncbi:molybdate ABC transporter substrate-binding protein [Pontibacillus salicampi]|uniref:Molybdate ABC transporter substrate-binding protein n=1 Tax=Pontibacillus salicampi TaxID=1449801 RepID=A0ABV6LPX6_9BACI